MPYVFVLLLTLFGLFRFATIRFSEYTSLTYQYFAAAAPYDVIIVPGSPYDTSEQNQMFRARMLWAQSLYSAGITRHIIYSGSAVHTAYTEGTIMKMISDSMGIPTDRTFAETAALHSDENINYSYKLARQKGFRKIAAASDPFQLFFLRKHIQAHFPKMALLPMPMDTFRAFTKEGHLPRIDAESSRVENFVPLNERE
ncbi:MAG: YdcF family protein [Bacteroidetes bacterium]|nr:YdcF family protein [Bacteroidota bacterium]